MHDANHVSVGCRAGVSEEALVPGLFWEKAKQRQTCGNSACKRPGMLEFVAALLGVTWGRHVLRGVNHRDEHVIPLSTDMHLQMISIQPSDVKNRQNQKNERVALP